MVWISENVSLAFIIYSVHQLLYLADVDAPPNSGPMLYDLIANVTLDSVAGTTRDKASTVWKVHLAAGGGSDNEKWFMIQDLIVEETRKEMIFLGETILQVRIPHVDETNKLCLIRILRSGNAEIIILGDSNSEDGNSDYLLGSVSFTLSAGSSSFGICDFLRKSY